MSDWLSEDQLSEFTGFKWKNKQMKALAEMRVKFVVNGRGRILVSSNILDEPVMKKHRPNWDAIRG